MLKRYEQGNDCLLAASIDSEFLAKATDSADTDTGEVGNATVRHQPQMLLDLLLPTLDNLAMTVLDIQLLESFLQVTKMHHDRIENG